VKKIGIVIPAGGAGTRMGTDGVPKQFMSLDGKPVLAHAIAAFRCVARYAEIVVALPPDRIDEWSALCREHDVAHHTVCAGGATRFLSVKSATERLAADCEYIMVHDAARPLVSGELILRALETARRHGSAVPVVAVTDSVRRVTDSGSYPEDRAALRAVQTPQVFRADILRTALDRAAGDSFGDEATAVESVGYTVALCEGEPRNMKITGPGDIAVAESLMRI